MRKKGRHFTNGDEARRALKRVTPVSYTHLEALRGLAACSVVIWHLVLAFWPYESGFFPVFHNAHGVRSQIWFGAIHGDVAVAFFFVLSGYVLTRAYFLSRDPLIIMRNGVKRWPRLAIPVLCSTVLAYVFLKFDLVASYEAGMLTQSPWLQRCLLYTSRCV